jgi:indolepyruvate ferredoxin oxidoreductase beta subunit
MATALKELNIIMAGVGGQGVVLMSEILGDAAVHAGFKVRGSEVLGMAQRGGSVFSNIRLGTDVEGPVTSEGKCDVIITLEPSEGLRYIQYLNKTTTVILNIRKVIPATVTMGRSIYPEIEQIKEKLQAVAGKVITMDAVELAEKAGNRQTTNVIMLGALFGCGKVPISVDIIKELVRQRVPARAVEANMKAFDLGYEEARRLLAA